MVVVYSGYSNSMKITAIKSRAVRVALAISLLAGACAIALAAYTFQSRQYVGASYTSLVADVVRPPLHAVLLRNALKEVDNQPETLDQLSNLLWRTQRHIEAVSFGLSSSELAPEDYMAMLVQLQISKKQLFQLQQTLTGLDGEVPPDTFIQQGLNIENDLARVYSKLSEFVHSEAAKQRIIMERLALAIAALVFMVLILVSGLFISLVRLDTERQRVTELSQFDQLTQLGNRRYLHGFANSFCQQSLRSGRPLGLALLDIDHFKSVNDTFGHPAGDKVLQVLAKVLRGEAREADVLARIGGEEFCLLMPDTDEDGALKMAERIRQKVSQLTTQQLHIDASITVSLGVATARHSGVDLDSLYARADKALYHAKLNGRNRTEAG